MAGGKETSEYKLTRNAAVGYAAVGGLSGTLSFMFEPRWVAVALASAAMLAIAIVIGAYAFSRSRVKNAETTADGEVRKAEAMAAPIRAAIKPTSRSV